MRSYVKGEQCKFSSVRQKEIMKKEKNEVIFIVTLFYSLSLRQVSTRTVIA